MSSSEKAVVGDELERVVADMFGVRVERIRRRLINLWENNGVHFQF